MPIPLVVQRLLAHQSGEVATAGLGLRGGDVPTGEVAAAGVEDLALRHRGLHGLPDLVPRGVPVNVVKLEQVDVVGLQPLQALVERAADVQGRELGVVGPVGHVAVHLRGQHGVLAAVAALGEIAADDALGGTAAELRAVDVGGVEEVEAGGLGGVHDLERRGLIRLGAEVHGAQAETRN
jgi:hypothetical protein